MHTGTQTILKGGIPRFLQIIAVLATIVVGAVAFAEYRKKSVQFALQNEKLEMEKELISLQIAQLKTPSMFTVKAR